MIHYASDRAQMFKQLLYILFLWKVIYNTVRTFTVHFTVYCTVINMFNIYCIAINMFAYRKQIHIQSKQITL